MRTPLAALALALRHAAARAAEVPPAPAAGAPLEERLYLASDTADDVGLLVARVECVAYPARADRRAARGGAAGPRLVGRGRPPLAPRRGARGLRGRAYPPDGRRRDRGALLAAYAAPSRRPTAPTIHAPALRVLRRHLRAPPRPRLTGYRSSWDKYSGGSPGLRPGRGAAPPATPPAAGPPPRPPPCAPGPRNRPPGRAPRVDEAPGASPARAPRRARCARRPGRELRPAHLRQRPDRQRVHRLRRRRDDPREVLRRSRHRHIEAIRAGRVEGPDARQRLLADRRPPSSPRPPAPPARSRGQGARGRRRRPDALHRQIEG
jgi:hypothetical protein